MLKQVHYDVSAAGTLNGCDFYATVRGMEPTMFTRTHLNLRSMELEAPAEWVCMRQGLLFAFVKEGTADCISGPALQPISAGDVLVLDGTTGSKLRVANGPMVFGYFSASLEHLLPLLLASEVGLLRNISGVFKEGRLYPASSALARKCRQLFKDIPSQFDLEHRSQLLRIVAAVLAAELTTAHPARSLCVQRGEDTAGVFGKLSTPELLNLSVGDVASKFGCSRRHLNRLFHQHFGVSMAALKMEMRLLKAVSLLRTSDTKIISVAEECGFNHLGSFNTRFKRRFGASPGEWRKLASRGNSKGIEKTDVASASPDNSVRLVASGIARELQNNCVGILRLGNEDAPNGSSLLQVCAMTASSQSKINATDFSGADALRPGKSAR